MVSVTVSMLSDHTQSPGRRARQPGKGAAPLLARSLPASILNAIARSGGFMKSELKKLYELIEEIEIAMMTTRRPDGHLESRAMANQKVAAGADLWFVTAESTGKVRDLESDPHINLAYYKER